MGKVLMSSGLHCSLPIVMYYNGRICIPVQGMENEKKKEEEEEKVE